MIKSSQNLKRCRHQSSITSDTAIKSIIELETISHSSVKYVALTHTKKKKKKKKKKFNSVVNQARKINTRYAVSSFQDPGQKKPNYNNNNFKKIQIMKERERERER